MSRRRTAIIAAAAVVAVALVVAGVVLVLRGDSPETVAEDYLTARWEGDPKAECELATEQWRVFLYEGVPFASCAEFAEAKNAAEAEEAGDFEDYRDDTDIRIEVETYSEDGDVARVGFTVELAYHGEDVDGFNELLQGGSPVDRGTLELTKVDGDWRVQAVDAG